MAGEASEVLPLQKRGERNFLLAVLKGGGTQKVLR